MLSRFLLMAQAAVSNGEFLDLVPPFDDGCAPSEVDVGGGEIAEAFMVSAVVAMLDEGVDMALKVSRQIEFSSKTRFFNVWCQRSILPCVWG